MTWELSTITAAGSEFSDADSGGSRLLPLVDPAVNPGQSPRDELVALLMAGSGDDEARRVAQAAGLLSVHPGPDGSTVWVDHTVSPRGDDLVATLKIASPIARDQGRLLVMSGLIAIGPDDDYDSLPALGAAVIRLRVDQWVGVGIEAKALATQVGLEGSWDGESFWLEHAADAYDYLRDWQQQGDVVLLMGHRFGELPGLIQKAGLDR